MNILRIGRYRVLHHLGGGGSAEVYAAEDTLLHRKVALKVLNGREADGRQSRHFEREVRSASLLNHPNVVTVYDIGREGDVQYITTELIDGETLRERIDRGPLTIMEVIDIARLPRQRLPPHMKPGSCIAMSSPKTLPSARTVW